MGGPKRGPKMDPFGVKMGHFRGVPRSEGVPKRPKKGVKWTLLVLSVNLRTPILGPK